MLAVAMSVGVAVVASPSMASAQDSGVSTVADGLDGPRQLNSDSNGMLVVAESDTGEVSSVDPLDRSGAHPRERLPQPQGIDLRDNLLFIATGEEAPDMTTAAEIQTSNGYADRLSGASRAAASSLIVARPNGTIIKRWDLLCYELRNNPDRQPQFDRRPVSRWTRCPTRSRSTCRPTGSSSPTRVPTPSCDRPAHQQDQHVLRAAAGARVAGAGVRGANDTQAFRLRPGADRRHPDKHGNIYVSTLGGYSPNAAACTSCRRPARFSRSSGTSSR